MSVSAPKPLAGRGIVITRPAHQAQMLAAQVRAAGGRVILFPTIEITEPENLRPFHAVVDRLQDFDVAIFVSPNAVSRAFDLIAARRTLPRNLVIAAMGDATVGALQSRGVPGIIAPVHSFDSEALLALPAFQQAKGKRVVIVRGQGGRELLGATLIARGAHVEYAECYRRIVPKASPAPLYEAWSRNELHAFVVTSSIGLKNLFEMIGAAGAERLAVTPVFVPHSRIAENAATRGLQKVVVTAAGDAGVAAALCAYFSAQSV